jgi:hypothetical protein
LPPTRTIRALSWPSPFPAAATIAYVADKVRDYVGVGNPYYAFATIPAAVETNIAADFTDAPIVSISVAENEAAINGMLQDSALQALAQRQGLHRRLRSRECSGFGPIASAPVASTGRVLNQYSLSCAAGSFTLTGQSAGLRGARRLTASLGSFVLTGKAAGLAYGHKVTAAVGSFALSGQAIAFARVRRVTATYGAFTLTGEAAAIVAQRRLACAAGSFALSGQSAGLRHGFSFAAIAGSFALTGSAIAMRAVRRISIGQGSFALTGTATGLRRAITKPAGQGAFALTGQSAAFARTHGIGPAAGLFTLSGSAGFRRTRDFRVDRGNFSMLRVPAALRASLHTVINAGGPRVTAVIV